MIKIFGAILGLIFFLPGTLSFAQVKKIQAGTTLIKSNFMLPDSLLQDSLDVVLSDQLDSMVNTWYVHNAFPDSLQKINFANNDINNLPDSLFIKRLQNIDSYIPLPFNEIVKKFINFYVNKRGSQVAIMMGLTQYYFPLFEEALAKYNLPLELRYLPIIESALNPKIVSRAGASGLWQFMLRTGKMYGLEVNSYIDERNDPIKSTDAAARYLRDLFALYGDWHLVIAAYNCGPGNINKAVRRSGGKQNYWEIYSRLPRETRGYIPIYIAANYVMNYGKEHNITPLLPSFNINTDTIIIRSYLNFEQISANLDIPVDEIRQLNPQYKRNIIPAKPDKPFVLKLPADKTLSFVDCEKEIFAYNREKYFPNNQLAPVKEINSKGGGGYTVASDIAGKKKIIYTVVSGDNPGAIASRFKVSINHLREWNDIFNMIHIGQKLTIYVNDDTKSTLAGKANKNSKTQLTTTAENLQSTTNATTGQPKSDVQKEHKFTYYTVRIGDSLTTIAKQFAGVSDNDIKLLNNIANPTNLVVGQKLKIPIKA